LVEDINKMAEKYIQEMRKAAGEAQKGIEKAAQEMDRVGRMMYEDVRTGLKESEHGLSGVRDKMVEDLNRELPSMMEDMRRLENRMERYMKEMQDEVRKRMEK
jgi:hypothetical protein